MIRYFLYGKFIVFDLKIPVKKESIISHNILPGNPYSIYKPEKVYSKKLNPDYLIKN